METIKNQLSNKKIVNSIFLAGLVVQLAILFASHNVGSVWDEDIFRNNIPYFEEYGLSKEFLVNIDIQAPGPLYQMVHYFFKPFTGYEIFKMRIVTLFLLLINIWVLHLLLRSLGNPSNAFYNALFYIAIPGVFATGLLAMSEIPTLLFASLFLHFFFKLINTSDAFLLSKERIIYTITTGICLGLTVIGRSPFLVLIGAIVISMVFVELESKRTYFLPLTIVIFISALIFLPVFLAWGGLIPPKIKILNATISDLNYINILIGLIHVALLFLIICPKILWLPKKYILFVAAAFVLSIIFNISYLNIFEVPGKVQTLIETAQIHGSLIQTVGYIIPVIYFTLGVYISVVMLYAFFTNRANIHILISIISLALIIATQVKMANYNMGVRHVAQLAPFFILLIPVYGSDKLIIIRYLAGISLGILLITHHFWGTTTILY